MVSLRLCKKNGSVLIASARRNQADLPSRRAVVLTTRRAGVKVGQYAVGQLLAELDTPLIEGVDVPDDALHKHFVFVKRNQGAEGSRVKAVQQ